MKKAPMHSYSKRTGRMPVTAQMASESRLRTTKWLQNGCNGFHMKSPVSNPMSFWTEQDVLQYLRMTGIPYASIYGDIVEKNGKLVTTGAQRTGCMFCMFGLHLEKEPNRFQAMALAHPRQYEFCISKLGCGKVLDFIGVPYRSSGAGENM